MTKKEESASLEQQKGEGEKSRISRFLIFYVIAYVIVDGFLTAMPIHINDNLLFEFGLTEPQYYVILSIASLGLIAVFALQYFADIIGRKWAIIISFIGMTISGSLMGFALDEEQFTIFFFFSFFFVSSDVWVIYVSEEVAPQNRGRAIFWITIFTVAATFIGPIARRIAMQEPVDIASAATWRYLPMIFIVIIPIALLGFGIKESSAYIENKKSRPIESIQDKIKKLGKVYKGEYKVRFLVFILSGIYLGLGFTSISLFDPFLHDYFGNTDQVTTTWIIMSVFAMAAFFLIGPITDKFGRKSTSYVICIIELISLILLVLSMYFLPIISQPLIAVLSGLTFAAYYSFLSLNRVHCVELFPTEIRGTALAWRSFAFAIAVVGGSALSALLTNFIEVGYVFIIYSCLIPFVMFAIWKYLPETKNISIR